MTLLDRFRSQSRHKHPDPAVRLAFVEEIPLEDREMIAAIAREDDEPRVRRAAVSKLMDAKALASILRDDPDESVQSAASAMLRDMAFEVFEGLGEGDSIDAVDGLGDARLLAQIAKGSARRSVALRALSRVHDARALGSIARHAISEEARLGALDTLRGRCENGEILAVALNGEHKDTAVLAVDMVTDRGELEQIAVRARNKSAAKHARLVLRGVDELVPDDGAADVRVASRESESDLVTSIEFEPSGLGEDARFRIDEELVRDRDLAQEVEQASPEPADDTARRESERRHGRLAELVDLLTGAADDPNLSAARRVSEVVRREWEDLSAGVAVDPNLSSRFADAEGRVAARAAEAQEVDLHARREALARIRHLLDRVEPLAAKPDITLGAASRALRHVRAAISPVPSLPTRQDAEEVSRRLKAVQAALAPRVQELRAADEWQRWSNVAVQEQLIAKMEALVGLDDPDAIAREVRTLQQQWRQVANVPRAQADSLWRRFKTAHDAVWPRCEAHFAAQAQVRAENLAKKCALCEKAEALAESTRWIQTAEEIKRLQAEWKVTGPVSRGSEKAVWDRFRMACDRFFTRRQADLAERKKSWAENLAKKEALSARAEALADSIDWEQTAAELRRLQAEWRVVGPVKRNRSEAIWARFHDACNRFFTRHAQRHDIARVERVAVREAICVELESFVPVGADEVASASLPSDVLTRLRDLRTRWQRETALRGVDPDQGRALDERFAGAFSRVLSGYPAAFAGTEFDVEGNRRAMELLVQKVETLAASLAAPPGASAGVSDALSPTSRLAVMLKEALAANTIGGKAEENGNRRAAADEVRQAQAAWTRVGFVPEDTRRSLTDRFRRACRQIVEHVGDTGATGRPDRPRGRGEPGRTDDRGRGEAGTRRVAEASEVG